MFPVEITFTSETPLTETTPPEMAIVVASAVNDVPPLIETRLTAWMFNTSLDTAIRLFEPNKERKSAESITPAKPVPM